MSFNAVAGHTTVPQLPFVQHAQRVCAHLQRRSLVNNGEITREVWTEAVGSADDLTKDFMQAHGTPAALHDYFTACTNRGVAVDEAAAMDVDTQMQDEHRGFASCLQRHQFTTCAQWRLANLVDSDYQLLRHQPDDANLFDALRFDLDDDDDPDGEHLRTQLYWYYNPAGAPLSFLVYTQTHTLLAPSMEASMFKRRAVNSE